MKESEKIKAELDAANNLVKQLERRLVAAVVAELGFAPGDIVNVTSSGKTERGIYDGSVIQYGEVRHDVCKIKKDGAASQVRIYTGYGAKIEKA